MTITIYKSKQDALTGIKALDSQIYTQSHGEYSRPDYKVKSSQNGFYIVAKRFFYNRSTKYHPL